MKDKRDECKCHRGCVTYEHECEKPCDWPNCLTPEEEAELMADLEEHGW